jgi:outer membrane protein assembly factor BamB
MRISAAFFGVWLLAAEVGRGDDWPQWRGPKRDGVWRESGIVEKLPPQLPVKWRTRIGGGYAGPAVAAGRVYVTERVLQQGDRNPDDPFSKNPVQGGERLICLSADTGQLLWKLEYPCVYRISYPSGPRATPTVHDGKVYALGAMGNLFCLEAAHGSLLWSKNYLIEFGAEINTWGTSSAPLVDGQKLIALAGGTGGACVVALDKDTGKEIWRSLDAKDPGYAPPAIVEAGGKRQLIIWTPEALQALDPESGRLYWRQPFSLNSGLSIPTPIFDPGENLLFVTAFFNGPLMMKLDGDKPAAALLWKGKSNSEMETDGLHSIMCTPVFNAGHIYGVCSYGQLRCLEARTGKRVWETVQATGSGRWWNAFLIPHGDRVIICNEQGDLIFARLAPSGYEELCRAPLIQPTQPVQRRKVVWSHPAFANRCVYARNDEEILCADLSAAAGR